MNPRPSTAFYEVREGVSLVAPRSKEETVESRTEGEGPGLLSSQAPTGVGRDEALTKGSKNRKVRLLYCLGLSSAEKSEEEDGR
jgi:hypothetical protein